MEAPVRRASRTRGKARVDDILKAAEEVLIEAGYGRFTLRSVAEAAGVRLNHLTYYFPTKRDLVLALLHGVAKSYAGAVDRVLAAVPNTPTARFMAWIDFLIDDCWTARTRRFFIQLWGLMESEDAYSGTMLREFYDVDVRELFKLLKELSPHMDDDELHQRATIIAGLIEGMMLFADTGKDKRRENAIRANTRKQIFKIATED